MPALLTRTLNALTSRRHTRTDSNQHTTAPATAREIRREWDRQLALAISDRDRAEIDAIFSRALTDDQN